MKIQFIAKSGIPVIEVSKYMVVRSDCFNDGHGNGPAIIMGMEHPRFIGKVFKTTNPEAWETFMNSKPGIYAALRYYMVGVEIVGSVDEYDKPMAENAKELATIAREMIDFYKEVVIENTKPSVFARYKIRE